MAWGKEWVKLDNGSEIKLSPSESIKSFEWPAGTGSKTLKPEDVVILGNNKIPTHDPYTNPSAYLYYECKCGQRLDPHTKRFAELNNAAMNNGWKIRWGSEYYIPYCPECGKDVE